jgi:hypothetical protein
VHRVPLHRPERLPVHNPLSDDDSEALIRLLTLVEGSLEEDPSCALGRRLRDSFAASGLLTAGAPVEAVVDALAHLQARYRYALGEYTERVSDACGRPGEDPCDHRTSEDQPRQM